MIPWLQQAINFEQQGNIEEALDIIFNTIDDSLIAGLFGEVDLILTNPETVTLPTDLLLGVITVTRPYRHKLFGRDSFCRRAKTVFIERGEDANALLTSVDIST